VARKIIGQKLQNCRKKKSWKSNLNSHTPSFQRTNHSIMLFNALFFTFFVFLPMVCVHYYGYLFTLTIFFFIYLATFLIIPTAIANLYGKKIGDVWVVEHSSLVKMLGLKGLAIYPVVFVEANALTKKGNSTVILRHETIHLRQQKECFILPFYVFYLVEEAVRAIILKQGWEQAYLQISFEREAYTYEAKRSYLKNNNRKPFAWMKYIFTSIKR
jgi:hypothetical protein